MRQISSNLTFLLKYILPWAIIIAWITTLILVIKEGQFTLAFALVLVGIPLIGFMKAMLMGLKKVLLDEKNKLLIVHHKTVEIIPFADIKEIVRPWTPPYISTVKLNKVYSFGSSFTYISKGDLLFWEDYSKELQEKTRN